MTPAPVVDAALRDLMARRVARAYLGLMALGVLSGAEWLLTGPAAGQAFWALLGVPLSGLALLLVGSRAALGGGIKAFLLRAIPFVHALFVLAVPGLRRLAFAVPEPVPTALGLTYAILALRLLRDGLRVAEVERLRAVMAAPAREEGVAGDG